MLICVSVNLLVKIQSGRQTIEMSLSKVLGRRSRHHPLPTILPFSCLDSNSWRDCNAELQSTPPCEAPLSLVYNDNAYFTDLALPRNTSKTTAVGLQVYLDLPMYKSGCTRLCV